MRILFIVPYAPNQIRTRPFNLIKALTSAGHEITLATLWSGTQELETIEPLAKMVNSLMAEEIPAARSVWNCVRALPGSQPLQACYSWSPSLARRIALALQTGDFDVVHVEHLRGAKYALLAREAPLRPERKRPPVVWDSVDCISDLFRLASKNSRTLRARLAAGIELPRTEKYEGRLASQFDRVLVTSETDRRGLLNLLEKWHRANGSETAHTSQDRISVLPNGVDLAYFSPSLEARAPGTLVITGKMSYHANVTAVVRFVEGVMPRVWAASPEIQLWIVGKDPSLEIRKLGVPFPAGETAGARRNGVGESRIRITGSVEDIRPFLRKATLAVAPIQYGVGIQNKVLEAMACATPVVASPEATGALGAQPGRDLVVAEGEEQMAESILSLLGDPERCLSLGRAGRAFVEENHDWARVAQNLLRIYQELPPALECASSLAL